MRWGVKLGNLSVPQPTEEVTKCSSLKILGVTVTDTLSFDLHISNVVTWCAQTSYALRILRSHGLSGPALWNVTRATLISKLLYASHAWFGFLSESCKARCQGVIQKLKRSGYLGSDFESFTTLCEAADAALFSAILCNKNHVLHQLLPPVKNCNYNLRPRVHTRELPPANTKTVKRNFIFRMLYYFEHVRIIIYNR